MWMFLLKFTVAFIAIVSLLLLVTGIIAAVNNPQMTLDENGVPVERGRNVRIWLGLITSIFWAIFL